jgi:DNA-binding XRE family transcriptional regulator
LSFGLRHCLLGIRLLEAGVTFVKVTHSNYDSPHENFEFRMKTKDPAKGAASNRPKRVAGKRFVLQAQRVTIKGKSMVLLEASEFDRLLMKADEFEPRMPEPNADGNYPALETLRVGLAVRIIRHRRKAGLTQAELAQRAGVRPEVLSRIEQGLVDPGVRTIGKIDKVLRELVEE